MQTNINEEASSEEFEEFRALLNSDEYNDDEEEGSWCLACRDVLIPEVDGLCEDCRKLFG